MEQKFGDSYLLFNLSSKTRDQIDYGQFKNQVAEFAPTGRQDVLDDAPAIGAVFRFLYTMEFWLNWDAGTAAVIFCNNSLARSAFFVSAYLVYCAVQPSMEAAMAAVSEQRTGDPGALRETLWPSWLRLQAGMDRLLRGEACLPKVQGLSHIILQAPELRAYLSGREELGGGRDAAYPVLQLFHGPKIVWDSTVDGEPDETVRWDDDKLIAEISLPTPAGGTATNLVLCGDYQLWVSLPPPPTAWPRQYSPSAGRMPGLDELGNKSVDTMDGGRRDQAPVGGRSPDRVLNPKLLIGRWAFHTSYLDLGVSSLPSTDADVFRPQLTGPSFILNLILEKVPPEVVAGINLDRLMRRSFLNLTGMRALQQGANDFSSRHYVFPDTALVKQLAKEGIDTTAAVCALQRGNNQMGRAREGLDCPSMKEIFKEAQAMRDLQMIRATLTMDEIAGVLSARANMAVKTRGLQISDLDFTGLLAAAKLGNVTGGKGTGAGKGDGKGKGKGGRGKGKGKKKKKKGKGSDSESDSDSSASDVEDGSGSSEDEEEEEKKDSKVDDDVAALVGKNGPQGKLFEGDAPVKDEEEEEEDEVVEEEGGEDWLMKDHPIFGKWFKALADGSKSKAALAEEVTKEQWNAALLDQDPNAVVPDIPATSVPLKDWALMDQYSKMAKVGLPRPMVEHKMTRDFLAPALLDADPNSAPSATIITPAKKGGSKKPSIIRKKLHWVPIKGKVEGSIWGGPPGDLAAAAAQLITYEEEFNRLFIQRPEDLKKKKKKDAGGVVQLLDHKRAMNAGIALAKLHMPYPAVVQCLLSMCARTKDGKGLLTGVELANLVTLSPTDEEVKIVKGFKGDVKRLGPAETFFLAVSDVPACKGRAQGLYYQFEFDERVRASKARINTFSQALKQIKDASRLRRLLKAVLVLGNKMNGIDKEHKKGVVKAFTVASLHQVYLTKSFDPTVSVLQYLFKLLRKVDPDLLRLGKDFPNSGALLGEAARLSIETLSADVRELREGLTSLEATVKDAAQAAGGLAALLGDSSPSSGPQYIEETVEVAQAAESSSSSSEEEEGGAEGEGGAPGGGTPAKKKHKRKVKKVKRRVEPLPVFVSLAQGELARLTGEFDTVVAGYKDLVKWFKEDPELSADDMFGSLRMFIQTWETQLKLLADRKRKEKEAKKRAKEMKKRKEELERKRAAGSGSGSGSEKEESGSGASSSASGSTSDSDDEDEDSEGKEKVDKDDPLAAAHAAMMSRKKPGLPPAKGGASKLAGTTSRKGVGGSKGRHAPSSSASTAGTQDSSDYELGSSTSSKAGGKTAAWATSMAGTAEGNDDDDEEDEDEEPSGASASGGGGMGGLLAAIKGKARGGQGGSSPAPKAASPAPGGDPKGGLLAAIAARGKKEGSEASSGGTAGGPGGGSPGQGTSAKEAKEQPQAKNPDGWRVGKDEGDDPEADGRNSLLAAIAKRRKDA